MTAWNFTNPQDTTQAVDIIIAQDLSRMKVDRIKIGKRIFPVVSVRDLILMKRKSGRPQDLQDIINEYGGEMPQTYGVPVEEIIVGIRNGVRKVNIDTDCRMAITGQFRKIAAEKKAEFDPRAFLKPAIAEMAKLCANRFEAFGTAGNASKIKPIPLAEMARNYQSGALDPKIAGAARAAE